MLLVVDVKKHVDGAEITSGISRAHQYVGELARNFLPLLVLLSLRVLWIFL